jgi:hypothetical protein
MIGYKEFLRIVDLLTYRLHRINVSPHVFGRAWPSLYYSRASKVFRKIVLHKCAATSPPSPGRSLPLATHITWAKPGSAGLRRGRWIS